MTNAFAVIHGPDVLTQACRDITDFFAFRRKYPTLQGERLIALWIGPEWTAAGLPEPTASDRRNDNRPLPIDSSTSFSGLWTIWWLEEAPHCERQSLLESLADTVEQPGPQRRFIPVFGSNLDAEALELELLRLSRCRRGEVGDPLYLDPTSSRLTGRDTTGRSHRRGFSL